MLAGFLGPSTVGVADIFAHGVMSWTTGISSEWNDLFMCNNIFDVFDSLQQIHTSEGSGCFIRVLIVSSQIINSALGGLRWLSWLARYLTIAILIF